MLENLKKWDGRDASGYYQYPLRDVEFWSMQIDANGSIYYTTHETPERLNVWCSGRELTGHLRHLSQIAARA